MTNQKEQSNMANINANELAETVSASLDKSQKNATNTEQSVRQVISMTGEDLHKDTVNAILNDQSIGIEKMIELVHSENADYDSRLGNNTSRVEQLQSRGVALSTSTATAFKYSVAGHLSFGAPKC